ncbi:ATP-binding protein [Streptomyces sp. NPDC057099]|uniref:ATP-binding protein n=1 Tax=Streptomyces sp. NPDC057099 TaxID=3346019 RepID=UPI0036265104
MTRLQEETPPGGSTRNSAATAAVSGVTSVQEDTRSTSARASLPTTSHACQAAFLPELSAVGEIRQTARAFLRRCGVTQPVAGFVEVAVSELVTNAVVHGEGEVSLRIGVTVDVVRVSVTDHSPAPAVLKQAGPNHESGRGIQLVDAMADAWESSGKETWCEFRDARAAA